MVLGFQLLCVVVHAFGASKDFAPFVRSFLQRNFGEQEDGIGVMAQCRLYVPLSRATNAYTRKDCLTKLDVLAMRGGRCKVLTIGEIEHASVRITFMPPVSMLTLVPAGRRFLSLGVRRMP